MNSNITQLCKVAKAFHEKHKDAVKDVILFGSLVRGKDRPSDIDILIIFFDKVNKDLEYELRQQCHPGVSVISKTSDSVCEESFSARESVLFEGYSLVRKRFIASEWGFSSLGLFVYQTRKLANTAKTRFYYALNGRSDSKGILDSLKAIKLSDNILAVPLEKIELAKAFFEYWGVDYTLVQSLIPSRLAKQHIIGRLD